MNIFQSCSHLHTVENNQHFGYDFVIVIPRSVFLDIRTDFEMKVLSFKQHFLINSSSLPH